MLDTIEKAIDLMPQMRGEHVRQVEYIAGQLLYRDREHADVVILSDRLAQIVRSVRNA